MKMEGWVPSMRVGQVTRNQHIFHRHIHKGWCWQMNSHNTFIIKYMSKWICFTKWTVITHLLSNTCQNEFVSQSRFDTYLQTIQSNCNTWNVVIFWFCSYHTKLEHTSFRRLQHKKLSRQWQYLYFSSNLLEIVTLTIK